MGVFNIKDSVIFGMPVVLNSLLIIPWLIVSPICVMIVYLATSMGLIPPVYLSVPWITPSGLYAYLATGGSVMATIVSLFNIFIAFSIYLPCVCRANKVKPGEE